MNNKKPKKIIHTGDQHIFFSKNFSAHAYVFDEFYKQIEREKPDLIVCTGDLIDSKIKLSNEQFSLGRSFLYNLSSYCPVIIILGNHDLNLRNKQMGDLISPIVNTLNSESIYPIHFFKHSGIYDLYNIKWAVWSCLDDQQKPNIVKTNPNDYVIGLFHGAIKGCISDNGFRLTHGTDVSEFDETDITMMGDIHASQTFRNDEVVYSGSLIQTKTSEPAEGSYVVWTWEDNGYKHEFKNVKNKYATIVTNLNDIETISKPEEDNHLIVEYDIDSVSKTELAALRKELKEKYNSVDLKPIRKVKKEKTVLDLASKKINLRDALKEYIKTLTIEKSVEDEILKLDDRYEKELNITQDFEYGDFSLVSMEVCNLLPFAPTAQKIDFNHEGIIGIAGRNRVGKSAILSALMFCLFNTSRDNNSSLKKLINKHNRSKDAFVKVILSKTNKLYKIERTLTPKKKDGVTITLDFYEIDANENVINVLTGEKRQDTEKIIQRYFGLESAFEILSLYSAQKRQQELIDCKNAERLKLVNRFIGSNNYEDKLSIVGDELRVEKGIYQSLSKNFDNSTNLSELENKLEKAGETLTEYEQELNETKSELELHEYKNKHLVSSYDVFRKISLKNVSNPIEVQNKIDNILSAIKTNETLLFENNNEIETLTEQNKLIAENFFQKYGDEIVKYKINWKEFKPKEDKLAVLKSDLKRLNAQVLIDECNSCGKPFLEKEKEKVHNQILQVKLEIEELNNDILQHNEKNNNIENIKDEYNSIQDKINSLERKNSKIILTNKSFESDITTLKLKSSDWDEVQNAKKELQKIEFDYKKQREEKEDYKNKIDLLQENIGSIKTEIKLLNKEIDDYNTTFNKLKESEDKMDLLKLYKDIVSKDGLPLFILQSKISEINEQVNLIVSKIFDFRLEFSIEGSDLNIMFFYENDDEKNDVGFASGSETFIINLCIKVGLSQVSELPKLTSLIIDEGYGTLDSEALGKIPSLFSTLPDYYKNIITISHIDDLKDLYNYEVVLKRVNKYTEIF